MGLWKREALLQDYPRGTATVDADVGQCSESVVGDQVDEPVRALVAHESSKIVALESGRVLSELCGPARTAGSNGRVVTLMYQLDIARRDP